MTKTIGRQIQTEDLQITIDLYTGVRDIELFFTFKFHNIWIRLEVVPSLLETSARFLRKSGVSIPPDEVLYELFL